MGVDAKPLTDVELAEAERLDREAADGPWLSIRGKHMQIDPRDEALRLAESVIALLAHGRSAAHCRNCEALAAVRAARGAK